MPAYIINFSIVALVVAGGVVLWSVFIRKRLSLEYCVYESDSASRKEGTVKYYNCWITNNGNRDLENITLKVILNSGIIDSVKIINVELLRLNDQGDTSIDAAVPLLKPNEKAGALISIKNPEGSSPLKIDARAGGIIAKERDYIYEPDELLRITGYGL